MSATSLRPSSVRLATRALIVENGRLLLVNAWPAGKSDLLCAPGGGVEPHASLPENLKREVHEETGLSIDVGPLCLVNEFHDPGGSFHQVDLYFWATVLSGSIDHNWKDPEAVVTDRRWVTPTDMKSLRFKPDSLIEVAFGPRDKPVFYDALEPILK